MCVIDVISLWRYFYAVQDTGRSGTDQICVTRVWFLREVLREVMVILEYVKNEGFLCGSLSLSGRS